MREGVSIHLERPYISTTGAIILSENISVDGHDVNVLARVITHIHSDHLIDLRKSILETPILVATPITFDLLEARQIIIPKPKKIGLKYGNPIVVSDDKLELVKSNHVPGSAQVLVEYNDGRRVGYTSDFKQPGTPVMKDLDVLVIDATYGFSEWQRPWQLESDTLLVDVVRDALVNGIVNIYAYNGKIEEVALLLRKHGIETPYIVSRQLYNSFKVLQSHGYRIDNFYLKGSSEAEQYLEERWCIIFHTYNTWFKRQPQSRHGKEAYILLTGWEFEAPLKKISEREWIVSFSDHADFKQLEEYVEEAKPSLLIVDAFRGGRAAHYFAKHISSKLGIDALVEP